MRKNQTLAYNKLPHQNVPFEYETGKIKQLKRIQMTEKLEPFTETKNKTYAP